ncbi:EamA family transporter, partial [Staphylococcus aureus]
VALALLSGLAGAPDGAWRGDLLMVLAAFCMALYGIWSKPFIRRVRPVLFTVLAMGAGAACLSLVAFVCGSFGPVAQFAASQWLAAVYLGA